MLATTKSGEICIMSTEVVVEVGACKVAYAVKTDPEIVVPELDDEELEV